ncbi:MAG: hypothetical protein EBT09_00030 [Actinobacteria bacterium]|nr:hypothetical protein [Actinomycetota bacterium]
MGPLKRRLLEAGSALTLAKRMKVQHRGLEWNTAQLETRFVQPNLRWVRHTLRVGYCGACPEAFGRRPELPEEETEGPAHRAPIPSGRWNRIATGHHSILQTAADRSRRK